MPLGSSEIRRFAATLFHPGELAYCDARAHPSLHLAARLAAKEAVIKALGIDGWDPLEIEVAGGAENVGLRLHGDVARRAQQLGVKVTVSMTHVEAIAGAVAYAHPRRPPGSDF